MQTMTGASKQKKKIPEVFKIREFETFKNSESLTLSHIFPIDFSYTRRNKCFQSFLLRLHLSFHCIFFKTGPETIAKQGHSLSLSHVFLKRHFKAYV